VYTAVETSGSWVYCGSGGGWDKSNLNPHTTYLALNEVVQSSCTPHSVYVNKRSNSVILRFLFAFPPVTGSNQTNMRSISALTLHQVN
jgi:hypothetical protein